MRRLTFTRLAATAALSLAAAAAAHAQTASISGSLGSFDVVNHSGQDAHGFEIRLEGASASDLYYTGFGQRYGTATVVPYATGVYVRWASPYDASAGRYAYTTPQHVGPDSFAWQDCYMGGAGYATSGCEAIGQGLRYPVPANVVATGHWLGDDPQHPGTLVEVGAPIDIPLLVNWAVAAGGAVGSAPVVSSTPEPPELPETPEVYGDAQWVKVYKTQLTTEVTAADFDSLNTIIPSDPSQVEVAWDILQASPPSGGNQNQTRNRNQGSIASDTRAIVRRFETYKYTGAYDAVTHKVVCADGTCTAPSAGELGDFVGATNSAVNVTADSLSVVKDGAGTVTGTGNKINCGGNCGTFAPNGTLLTLTANPGGNVFLGWTGSASGTQTTISVPVNGATSVGAIFRPQFTLSLGRSNSGSITGTPTGNDRALNCGGTCSAKFTQGTVVTLTAIPAAGKQFLNWTGGCSGTSPNCTVLVTSNTSVQAVFSK